MSELQISYLDLDIDILVRDREAILLLISNAQRDLSRLNDRLAEKAAKKQQLEAQDRLVKRSVDYLSTIDDDGNGKSA